MPHRSLTAPLAAFVLTLLAAVSGQAGEFTDSAGRHVMLPDRIGRVLTAGSTADALIVVLAPDKLVGWSRPPERTGLPAKVANRPVTGMVLGPEAPDAAGTVARLHPDMVIAAGNVSPARAALADQLQRQTGVPVVLVDASMTRTPATLRSLGTLLGVSPRAEDLATYAEHAINALRGRLLIQKSDPRPRVYYARGPAGLETALPFSSAGEMIDEAGAINVAGALGQGERVEVTPDQVAGWAPDLIIAETRRFYDTAHRNPAWRQVAAVRDRKVYLEPSGPFGWIDDPPGVNRVIGLHWLSELFYPDVTQEELRDTVQEFYSTFYQVKLTDAQLDALLKPAQGPHKADPMQALLGISAGPAMPSLPGTGALPALPPPGRRGPLNDTAPGLAPELMKPPKY